MSLLQAWLASSFKGPSQAKAALLSRLNSMNKTAVHLQPSLQHHALSAFLVFSIDRLSFVPVNINHSSILPLMALNSLYCADVPLSNYSHTHFLSCQLTGRPPPYVLVTATSMCTISNLEEAIFPNSTQCNAVI